jgi:hypothetical protein
MSETDGSPSADKDLTAELEKWKALARKHEERAKETFAELQKLKESQGSGKSDMDRLVQEIKALREENQKAKRDAMLASVAAKTGLSMAKVRRLQGENEAELLADAAEVFDWKPSDAKNGNTKDSQGDKDEPAKTDDAKADGKSNEGEARAARLGSAAPGRT